MRGGGGKRRGKGRGGEERGGGGGEGRGGEGERWTPGVSNRNTEKIRFIKVTYTE